MGKAINNRIGDNKMNRITTQQTTSITSLAIDAAEHKFAENYCELYAELYCAKEE